MTGKRVSVAVLLVVAAVVAGQAFVAAQNPAKKTIKRAKPPTFSKNETDRIFYENVFQEGLEGNRPADLGKAGVPVASSGGGATSGATGSGGGSEGGLYGWKEIISAEVIEDEIKRISTELDTIVTTPTNFAGGGNKDARRDFSVLASLFAISGEYDGDVRWKKDAPVLRDAFARAAASAKVVSEQAYQEAKRRKEELKELVQGQPFNASQPAEPKAEWPQIVNRAPLMQRLDIARESNLTPAIGSPLEFKANKDKLVHEANLVAAIAEILMQTGMENVEDESYIGYARRLKQGAKDVIAAVELDNFDNTGSAVKAISQACDDCHNEWQ